MSTLMDNKLRFIFRPNDVSFGQQKYAWAKNLFYIYLLQRINKNIYTNVYEKA